MRKFVVIAIVVAVVGGAAAYFGVFSREGDAAAAQGPGGMPGRTRSARAPAAREPRVAAADLAGLAAASADRVAAAVCASR